MLNPCYKTSGDYSDYRIHCAFVCIPNHKKFENFSFKKKNYFFEIFRNSISIRQTGFNLWAPLFSASRT